MDVKRIAKDFVTAHFNVRESFFEAAWDIVNRRYEEISSASEAGDIFRELGKPLGIVGVEKSEVLVTVVAFATMARQVSATIKPEDLKAVAHAAIEKYAEKLNAVIRKKLKDAVSIQIIGSGELGGKAGVGEGTETAKYLVLLPYENGVGTQELRDVPEQQMRDEYLGNSLDFALFVYGGNVTVRSGAKKPTPIQMPLEPRIRAMLIILLRYKDRYVPPIPLYRRAWLAAKAPLQKEIQYTTAVDLVDPAKSILAGQMSKHISGFELEKRKEGYICRGAFSFCCIIGNEDEREYCLLELSEI